MENTLVGNLQSAGRIGGVVGRKQRPLESAALTVPFTCKPHMAHAIISGSVQGEETMLLRTTVVYFQESDRTVPESTTVCIGNQTCRRLWLAARGHTSTARTPSTLQLLALSALQSPIETGAPLVRLAGRMHCLVAESIMATPSAGSHGAYELCAH